MKKLNDLIKQILYLKYAIIEKEIKSECKLVMHPDTYNNLLALEEIKTYITSSPHKELEILDLRVVQDKENMSKNHILLLIDGHRWLP